MRRSLLVFVLLLVAVGVPCASWFVSGSREAEREARRVVGDAQAQAQSVARTMAGQLATRLEKLRASESPRPYFHYQNLMHDPRGASQGLSVVPSPLAGGPAEPLILTHFQLDPKGRVTMPTINDEVRELNAPDVSRQLSMRNALTAAAPELLRISEPRLATLEADVASRKKKEPPEEPSIADSASPARRDPPEQSAIAPPVIIPPRRDPWTALQQTPTVTVDRKAPRVTRTDLQQNSLQQNALQNNSSQQFQQQAPPPPKVAEVKAAPEQAVTVQKLDPGSFAQNAQSNEVYHELKTPAATRIKPKLPSRRSPYVEVATSDFAWSSVDILGKPSLAALRSVVTPDGAFVQGFLLSDAALGEATHNIGHLKPGAAGYPIGGTGWSLQVDDRSATATAHARAAEIRSTFRRTFYAGLGAAGLALIAVALLVWRTERLARERAQFAAAAAHELRTPLAGIRLYGDMLAHQLGNPERSKLYAQQVAQEADRLGRVVANMLEFTRLERGSLTVKPEPGDLGDAVRECVEQLRPALEVAGCSVKLSVADDLPSVAFDRDAVHHIVQNLLDNAEKYSRPSSDRSVDVEVARMNGHAAVTVSDRGAGIDARVARHLFLPFERGANGDAPAGLGLGLVLVKALAEAHGGDVSWSARSGGGTTFRVRLPAFYTA